MTRIEKGRVPPIYGTYVPMKFAIYDVPTISGWNFDRKLSKTIGFEWYSRITRIAPCTYRRQALTSSHRLLVDRDHDDHLPPTPPRFIIRVNKPTPPPPYLGCAVWTAFRSYACAAFAPFKGQRGETAIDRRKSNFAVLDVFTCRCSIIRRRRGRREENPVRARRAIIPGPPGWIDLHFAKKTIDNKWKRLRKIRVFGIEQ